MLVIWYFWAFRTTTTDIVANWLLFHANWHFLHPNSDFIAFSVHYFFRARNLSCKKFVGFTSLAKSLVPSRKFSGPDSDPPQVTPNVQNLPSDGAETLSYFRGNYNFYPHGEDRACGAKLLCNVVVTGVACWVLWTADCPVQLATRAPEP